MIPVARCFDGDSSKRQKAGDSEVLVQFGAYQKSMSGGLQFPFMYVHINQDQDTTPIKQASKRSDAAAGNVSIGVVAWRPQVLGHGSLARPHSLLDVAGVDGLSPHISPWDAYCLPQIRPSPPPSSTTRFRFHQP